MDPAAPQQSASPVLSTGSGGGLRIRKPLQSSAGSPSGKKKPELKIFTGFGRKASPVTVEGTFDEGGLKMSEKGLADGEQLFELHDFEKVRHLGSGAQGTVNEVVHKATGQHYAMKVQQLQQEEAVRKKQVLELRTLRKSHHPSVVTLFDAFYSEGSIYTLLELMDCGTLQQLLTAAGSVPEPQLGKIAVQLLDGLAYIHKEFHVLHRDIKPANVLINTAGEAKLSDFGVSGEVASTLDQVHSHVGSSAYMSPERINGEPHRMSSDCWSLGLIILECALGYFPFCDPNAPPSRTAVIGNLSIFSLMEKISTGNPLDGLARLQFSAPFKDFVSKCLMRDANARPSSSELLQHPWIVAARKDKKTNLQKWIAATLSKK